MNEYTEEEKAVNGNQMYGGKRHDEICDYLQEAYKFNETQINDISMGVWKGIESERKVKDQFIKELELEQVRHIEIIEEGFAERVKEFELKLNEAEYLLSKANSYLRGQILNTREHVRQVDGTIAYELVPTFVGELVKELEKYRFTSKFKGTK